MSASATVRAGLRIPLAKPVCYPAERDERHARQVGGHARAQQIRRILAEAGLTVTQVSALSRDLYGDRSAHAIPPTFLYKLKTGVDPHICQILALSEITGFRFVDWMSLCGFDLHRIAGLQLQLHADRTVLITPIESDPLPWFLPGATVSSFSPNVTGSSSHVRAGDRRYLFAKIGGRDALVCPELAPGSVVRIDRQYPSRALASDSAPKDGPLWLIEHTAGLTCCRLKRLDDEHVALLPSRPPFAAWPLCLSTEVRIRGMVDLQLRPATPITAKPACHRMNFEQRTPPFMKEEPATFSQLLRASRCRAGMTFRAAHQMTLAIARILANKEYAIATGLLSDYETIDRLPRHTAKIISLCVAYCVDFWELMNANGVEVNDSAKMPLPRKATIIPLFPDSSSGNPAAYAMSRRSARQTRFSPEAP